MSQMGDDCYFYYNSTCTKGTGCLFRHVEAARGSETVCNFWQMGNCTRPGCKFRHMDIKIDRSKKPCYWENQPSGCTKSACPFKHFKPRPTSGLSIDEALPSGPVRNLAYKASTRTENVAPKLTLDTDAERASPKIEPVIVNPLEDDSECESVHGTPQKTSRRKEALDSSTATVVMTVREESEPPDASSAAVTSKPIKPLKRKIKLHDDKFKSFEDMALEEDTAAVIFSESDTRRNVIMTENDDHLGENFEDFMKKRSKNASGSKTVPNKKPSVLRRLGNPEANESKRSKTHVKKRLGRVDVDQDESVKVSILDRLGSAAARKTSSSDQATVKNRLVAAPMTVSPERGNVKNRLGGSVPPTIVSPERGTVKKRLGLMSASAKLGLKSLEELRTQQLQLQKELEEAEENESEDDEEESKLEPNPQATIKRGKREVSALPDPEDEEFLKDIKVKSLAQIRAEKVKNADIQKSEQAKANQTSSRKRGLLPEKPTKPKRKIMVYTELFEDGPPERSPSPEPEPAVKVKSLDDIRTERTKKKPLTAKKEWQIYMPPSMKNGAMKAPVAKPTTVEKEDKVEPKAKTKPTDKASIKTFSEIMAEKRRKLHEMKAKEAAPADQPRSKFAAKPIVFDVKDKSSIEDNLDNVKTRQTVNPLRSQAFQENVSINSSPTEPQAGAELRMLEDSVLCSKTSCDSVVESTKTEKVSGLESSSTKDHGDTVSPPRRRSSSQGSDMPTRKKYRQSLLNEDDDDDFFFGDDLDGFEDDGKVDESDLLQDIDELLA